MRLFRTSLFLFLAFLLNGCVKDNMYFCPIVTNSNLTLQFRYEDDGGVDVFPDEIRQVDVFVFDNAGSLVQKQTIDQTSLSVFAGTTLHLAPGTYHIVCWGNAIDKTTFDWLDNNSRSVENAFLGNSTLDENGIAINGDPLYYASQVIELSGESATTAPKQGTETAILSFCRAHIAIEAYVKGLEDKSASGGFLPPLIELTDIPAHYNFEMRTFGPLISYRGVSSFQSIKGEELADATFYTPIFSRETSMQIRIKKSSDDSVLTTINLADFIHNNNIILDKAGKIIIPILVEYKQASVSISLPDWTYVPVDPEQ